MLSTLKTPGVYVIEKNAFPSSVAQVATAIPAFIGFTEIGPGEPTKITSLIDFESIYGKAAPPENLSIDVATDTYDITESQFKLYNSLRLFYANGGGDCYIVSIGNYDSDPDFSTPAVSELFIDGLELLESFDEPTLLLFPDAINLSAANLGNVQKAALMQCAELMDRFTIMDVKILAGGLDTSMETFRDEVGNRDLKYGGAYYPYLQSSFGYQFRYNDIVAGGVDFRAAHSSNDDITSAIDEFDDYHATLQSLATAWETAKDDNPKLDITDDASVDDYHASLWNLLRTFGDVSGSTLLESEIENVINGSLQSLAQQLFDFSASFNALDNDDVTVITDAGFGASWDVPPAAGASAPNPYEDKLNEGATNDADFSKVKNQMDKLYNSIVQSLNSVISNLKNLELQEENNLVAMFPEYSGILSKLNASMNTVPPSGAIAGVYAYVDANRGVWKAPANVSLNGIIGLTDDVNDKKQATMNIHETGKSVNAIRKFTGKGLIVWGARTLDGNSNDWRYINVRRLAIMIEESCKKAAFNYVFEPNVKQTWVSVNGMISNYLTVVWRDGGLAGAKPEDAFFVSVGLGATMTAQDILEGRMIVQIGYAPSRPAEFIVLEFTQMQQKS